jgi:hypothetical protein
MSSLPAQTSFCILASIIEAIWSCSAVRFIGCTYIGPGRATTISAKLSAQQFAHIKRSLNSTRGAQPRAYLCASSNPAHVTQFSVSYDHNPLPLQEFAFIGSTKSGRRAEATKCNFTMTKPIAWLRKIAKRGARRGHHSMEYNLPAARCRSPTQPRHHPAFGDLAHLSPLGWEHINLPGDYHWDTSPTLGPDEFSAAPHPYT